MGTEGRVARNWGAEAAWATPGMVRAVMMGELVMVMEIGSIGQERRHILGIWQQHYSSSLLNRS
ncbi:unnamed protein product [Acanthoscelides obtectus]|uniref:Uncharacterized protein n=1 Tax=Acanthoscelides obtectus TaxID=200917 RepID=A0A9P0JVN3_ACAOB|nr:unnamed protein product [Acanthoscelides obtectus]CAK1623797.1 hypothetical protein AOBTE_LOCUS2191 [Acanthoscelides obtectus]